MYTKVAMLNLINLTKARNNLSKLIEQVSIKKKTYVLIRDSIPQAVIIPWEEYKLQEERWQEEVEKLMVKGRRAFSQWLKKRKIKLPKSENEVYQLVNQVAGRS